MDFLQGIRDAEEDAMSYFLDENGEFQMPTNEQMNEALKHLNLAEKEKDIIWNRLLGNIERKVGVPAGVLPLSDSPVIVQYILMVFFYVTIGLIGKIIHIKQL